MYMSTSRTNRCLHTPQIQKTNTNNRNDESQTYKNRSHHKGGTKKQELVILFITKTNQSAVDQRFSQHEDKRK